MDLQGSNYEDLRRLRLLQQSRGPLRVSVAPERNLITPGGNYVVRRSPNMRTAKPTAPKPKTEVNWSTLLDQGGDFGQAVIDRVGGGLVRGGIRSLPTNIKQFMPLLNLPVFNRLNERTQQAADEFVNRYAENKPQLPNNKQNPFYYNEQSTGGRIGRGTGTLIKGGIDLGILSKASSTADEAARASKIARSLDKGGKLSRFVSGTIQRGAGSLAGTGTQAAIERGQGKKDLNLAQNAAIGIGVDVVANPIIGKVWKYAAAGPTAKLLAKTEDPLTIKTILKESTELGDDQIDNIVESISKEKKASNIKNIIEEAGVNVDVPNRVPRAVDGPVNVDPETDVKIGNLLDQADTTPRPTGTVRIFQSASKNDGYTDWAFTDIDSLARWANNRPGEQVRFIDVPETAIRPTANGASVVRVNPEAIKPNSPQALEQAVEALPPNTAISQQTPVTQAPEGVPSTSADIAQADIGSLADKAAQEAQEMKDLYGKETLVQKIAKLWDPLSPLRKMDKARAKALGIRPVDLPKTQSVEALAQISKNSKEMAAQALKDTNTAKAIQKYSTKGPDSTDFNFYRVAMRDLEQRADGRPAIFRDIDDNSLNQWVAEYEARNPQAREDLLGIVSDIRAFQDYGAELVTPEDLARVRLKKDGTEFQFWTPIERATPDDVASPVVTGQNVGSVGRQKILQEQLGSDLPPDVSFDSLTDYVETVYKQVNQAKVARTVTENVQAGLVPGARVIQTGDETARITQLKQNLSELRDITKSLKDELKNIKSKVRLSKKDLAIAQKQLGIADEKQAGKVRMATSEANRRVNEATTQAKRLLKQTLGDDVDSASAIDSLTPDELIDLLGVSTQDELFSKGAKGKAQFRAVSSSKGKLDAAQQITKQQDAAYARIAKKSEAHRQLVERLQDAKMDIESLDNARKGIGRELVELRPDSITGRQTLLGIDENGNKFRIELPPEYASVLQGTDKEQMNTLLRGLRVAQQPWREAYTGILNPPFQVAQATFNTIMAPILKGPKVFGPRALKAAAEAFNGNSLSQQVLRENGITIYGGNLQKLVKDTTADALASQADALSRAKWFSNPKRAWEQLSLAGGKLDQAARAAMAQVEYDNSIKRSLTEAEALANAVYTYNNSLPNFGNAASLMTQIDAVVPYFAAGQTGTRQITRAIKENPVGVGGRIATFGMALSGLTAYNLAKDEGEAFYADMENSGKKYVLDNNVIFVLPGARKDPKTGEWTGIVKIPLPPELRPLGSAVRATFSPTSSGVPIREYATGVFNFITGGTASNRSPAIQTAYGVVTGKDPQTGRDIYDETMTEDEKRSAVGKYILGGFGLPGKVVTNGLGEVPDAFVNRVYGAKGISEGGQYYKNENDAIKAVGLNKNELDAYRSVIAPRSKDLAGNDIKDKTYYDSASKATTWLRYPKTFEVSKAMDAKNRAAGKPGDPLYDLPPDQLKVVLNLMANYSPGNFEEKAIQQLNPWIKDFNTRRSEYFDKVIPADKKSNTDAMGVTIPKATPEVQNKLNQLNTITDKAQRGQFYANNPDVTDFFAQQDNYQRTKRAFLGLPQFDKYPTTPPELQKVMDQYSSLPKGTGARSAWIKANPGLFQQMTDQWNAISTFKLQEEGAKAVYEGIDMEQETLAKALGLSSKEFTNQYGYVDKETALNLAKLLSPDKDYTFKGPNTKLKVQKVKYKVPKSVGKKSKVKLG